MKLILLLLLSVSCYSKDSEVKSKFSKVFENFHSHSEVSIPDPISDKPVNTKLLILKDIKKNIIGYAREIKTSTGCNSECLPVIFTLYYSKDKSFLNLSSKPGLTKKNHVSFTSEDYFRLKSILIKNPKSFKNIKHPYELVDMVSGATKSDYIPDVVEKAAYTSLRVNTYNQQTLKYLSSLGQ